MKIITNLATTLIILSVGWMTIQTIYGVGRAKGYVQAREEAMIQCETRINQLENRCDELIEDAKEEILSQF